MPRLVRPTARFRTAAAIAPLLLGAACGGTGDKPAGGADKKVAGADATVGACAKADTSAVYKAYIGYIKETTPTPQRFLTAAGTDSAAPDDGFRAMQDKGPSYFYGGDSVAQRKIREKLESVGPYASLLIVHRGTTTSGDTVTVRLGGHYIGGEHEGKLATERVMVVVCKDASWSVASSAEAPAK